MYVFLLKKMSLLMSSNINIIRLPRFHTEGKRLKCREGKGGREPEVLERDWSIVEKQSEKEGSRN